MKNKINLILLVILSILLIKCGEQTEDDVTWRGLIGAYYGDADLTNIKYPERIYSLDQTWDEATGHGSAWSGKYVGLLKAPVTGDITIEVYSSQKARFTFDDKETVTVDSSSDSFTVSVDEGEKYPIELIYLHEENRTGDLEISWKWEGKEKEIIPDEVVSFNKEQGEEWNWIPEPDPDKIDYSKFPAPEKEDVILYYEEGRFAGWPANNGIWIWGNEIVVGFTLGYYKENPLHHSIDEEKGSDRVTARSTDGGETWVFEGELNRLPVNDETVNFLHPDFAMMVDGDEYWVSYDRARSWYGPRAIPHFGWEKLTSRTDYIVEGKDQCIFFLSVEDKNVHARLEDRTFCARTTDGGRTFDFLSWIGVPDTHRAVMPSTVKISNNHFLTSLRRRFDETFNDKKPQLAHNWIDVYESTDNGNTWNFLSKVAETDMGKNNGNPPSMVKLDDGRVVVTYGYRAVPYGIRAKISDDNGKTWSDEIHLRDHPREFDMGYTRSVQRPDGKIVTCYYFTTEEKKEQHIAATIWDPDRIEW